MTLRFKILYVLVIIEIGSRRIVHVNVNANLDQRWIICARHDDVTTGSSTASVPGMTT